MIGLRLLTSAMEAPGVLGPASCIRMRLLGGLTTDYHVQTAALIDHIASSGSYVHLLIPQHRTRHLLLRILFAFAADDRCWIVCQCALGAFSDVLGSSDLLIFLDELLLIALTVLIVF